MQYDPREDGIFFWSAETCLGDEIGYSFIHKLITMNCSFMAFCKDMNVEYSEHNSDAHFISETTFINWFFAWAGALQLDFRRDQDPFCKNNPRYLVGDGTHMGISGHHMNVIPIDDTECDTEIPVLHKRFNRVFLFESENANKKRKTGSCGSTQSS